MEPCSTEAMWSILEIVVSAFDHLVIIPVAVWCASSVDVNNSVGGGWVHMPLIFTCVWNVCVCVWKVFVINYLFPLVWLPCTLVITFSIWKHFRKHFVWIHSHPRRMTRVSCWYMLHWMVLHCCTHVRFMCAAGLKRRHRLKSNRCTPARTHISLNWLFICLSENIVKGAKC